MTSRRDDAKTGRPDESTRRYIDTSTRSVDASARWRVVEFLALYIALPIVLWRVAVSGSVRMWVLPWLWVGAVVASVWLCHKRGWTLKKFFGFENVSAKDFFRLALRVAIGAAVLGGVLFFLRPTALFGLPVKRPIFWLVLMVAYPLLSVVPQGVVYRALFFERYAPLFGKFASVVAVVVFSLGHIVFNNLPALLLTLVGGALFVWQYRKTHSLALVNLEHAIFGDLAFTLGWGVFLHAGTLQLGDG